MRFASTAAFVVSLAIPLASTAQPAGKVYRIGLLSPTSLAAGIEAFREGLRTLGYVEGQNVVIEHRSADGRFDRLTQVVPKLHRVAVIWNPANSVFQRQMVKETETAARSLGIQLRFLGARDAKEIDSAFATFAKERPEALAVIADPVFVVYRAQIATLAATHHLASVSTFNEYPEAGGLMAYAPSFVEPGVRAAAQVDNIFKGAMPAELPVERTTKYTLVVNLRRAKVLGLTIPPSVSVRADRVISRQR